MSKLTNLLIDVLLAEIKRTETDLAEARELLNRIRAVGATPDAAQILGSLREVGTAPVNAPLGLSAKEKEVFALLAEHRTNAEISAALGITTRTVETHLHRMTRRLALASPKELRRLAQGRR